MSELTTPIKIDIPGIGSIESADLYLKSEVDKVIAELTARLQHSLPYRTCRKCGKNVTLMFMPRVDNNARYWKLFNNKGIDYVVGIQCANCGEVAFVTKQMHEDEIRHYKYKRCLAMARWCESEEKRLEAIAPLFGTDKECWEYNSDYWCKWHNRWLELAEKFKEAK